jgi:hypothetical protein
MRPDFKVKNAFVDPISMLSYFLTRYPIENCSVLIIILHSLFYALIDVIQAALDVINKFERFIDSLILSHFFPSLLLQSC